MASSKWREEYNLIYSTNYENVKEYQSDYIQDLIDSSPNVLHFDIHGGEPFLSKATDQKRLLQHYVSTGKSKHIDLHYITNATIFPDDEWWELWDNFKSVEIQLSLDAHGLRYNYIRFPGEWHSVLPNIELYLYAEKHRDNITLSVSHTVSAYNIYYLDCFYNWCINIGLPKPYLGRVNKPTHMQPEVWSEEAKEAIKEKLLQSKHPEVKQWSSVMERDTGLFEEFKYYMRKHDEYRKLSFCEYFPELACYVT
jgi:sulfatase maturation enzyme AslB (radical SAM superfamily)